MDCTDALMVKLQLFSCDVLVVKLALNELGFVFNDKFQEDGQLRLMMGNLYLSTIMAEAFLVDATFSLQEKGKKACKEVEAGLESVRSALNEAMTQSQEYVTAHLKS